MLANRQEPSSQRSSSRPRSWKEAFGRGVGFLRLVDSQLALWLRLVRSKWLGGGLIGQIGRCFLYVLFGFGLGVTLFAPSCAVAGAGHGDNVLLKVFFPFGMLVALLVPRSGLGELWAVAASLAQYPCYGIVFFTISKTRKIGTALAVSTILLIHSFCLAATWQY